MDLVRVTLLSLLLTAVSSRPSKPLDERSTELSWQQAWILFDDQLQNNKHDDGTGVLRRRITPKSIFVLPKYSCPDGHELGESGNCVIKINQSNNDEFLAAVLNAQYAFGSDDYTDTEPETPKEPVKINIPLDEEDQGDQMKIEQDVSIQFMKQEEKEENEGKEEDEGEEKVEIKRKEAEMAESTDEEDEIVSLVMQETTTPIPSTTTQTEETTTALPETTTTSIETSTLENQQALFFLEPIPNAEHVPKNNTTNGTTDTPAGPVTTTSLSTPTALPTVQDSKHQNLVRFPDDNEPKPVENDRIHFRDEPESGFYNNHRNRDKHLWRNYPWRSSTSQHPSLVFRFPRRHEASRDDLSYVFGKVRQHRRADFDR